MEGRTGAQSERLGRFMALLNMLQRRMFPEFSQTLCKESRYLPAGDPQCPLQSTWSGAQTLPTLPVMLSRTTTRRPYCPGGSSSVSL